MSLLLISDPHGFYSEVRRSIDPMMEMGDKLVILGDILDRGQEAVALCDFLMELYEMNKLILIKGNHEELFIDCLSEIEHGHLGSIATSSQHKRNGTLNTMFQLAKMSTAEALCYPKELVRRVKDSDFYKTLLPACVDYYETDKYILTHGWIPCKTEFVGLDTVYSYNPSWRDASPEEWHRARWLNGMDMAHEYQITEPNKTIICGHFHTSYGHAKIEKRCEEFGPNADFSPFFAEGIIAIDGCTSYSGMVNCISIPEN